MKPTIKIQRTTCVLAYVLPFVCGMLSHSRPSMAQDFEREPINYATAKANNPITRLQERLDRGETQLTFDDRFGYVKGVLDALNVPISSQTLVFSKTSLQRHKITPRTPRALYFSDDMYIGFCQGGDVVEISAVDPQLGAVFYTLNQEEVEHPRFTRHVDNCLTCHGSSHTRHVPGHFIRSVYVESTGLPALAMGTHRIDHTSPIANRWGGWYVTGTHGDQKHLGNLIVQGRLDREPVDNSAGQNVTDLSSRFQTSAYPSPHSDLVALMVLEHQAEAHNLLTRANYQAREALYSEERLNKELGEPEGHRWESTNTRIRSSSEELVRYLLFSGEAALQGQIRGTSSFADEFVRRGPKDSQGRSLRDFDLQHRLFKYPCSYLVYSESFDALPRETKDLVLKRLYDVLTGVDQSKPFTHLSGGDRAAILEILRDTKPDLPEYWRSKPASAL